MTDIVDRRTRSRMMASIRGRNTRPELQVRRFLHAKGLRFRLHDAVLPGTPDIVLPKYSSVVFVHGCFWHRHQRCAFAYTPRSNRAFWREKFRANLERDERFKRTLRSAGWSVNVIWECGIDKSGTLEKLYRHIRAQLGKGHSRGSRGEHRKKRRAAR